MSRLRRILLFALAPMFGVAIVVLPAVAGSETGPAITAENVGGGIYGETHRWNPPNVSVAEGTTVSFSNPTEVPHGVHWISSNAPVCTSGVPVGTTASASGTHWSGSCTFTTPGTYTFYCTVHGASMSGTITVPPATPSGSTPASTTPTPTTPGAGSTQTESVLSAAGSSPLLGTSASALRLSVVQRGSAVRGTVRVSAAGANGRLEVDLFANAASLARARTTRVGRLVRSSLQSGTVSFAVPLAARARRALRHSGHLALSVTLSLRPPAGSAVTLTRHVTLRR